MHLNIISTLHSNFEQACNSKDGVNYWFARDLQDYLGYSEWRNFVEVIEKAKISCEKSSQLVENHFVEVNKMVELGSGTSRQIKDYMLTRYACYLIAQNGDPRKEVIAFAQSYFAVQTRKQELLAEHIKLAERIHARAKLTVTERQLSDTLYQHGVDDKGFGEIRSKGDTALFGNNNTNEMKIKLGIKLNRQLADFLPTVTLKAKEFAAAITEFNVRKDDIYGKTLIGDEHVKNNVDVRSVLNKSNIIPEELPPEEDIKKLERRVRSQEKQMLKQSVFFSTKEEDNV